jgi:hypothetical protein
MNGLTGDLTILFKLGSPYQVDGYEKVCIGRLNLVMNVTTPIFG